MKKDLLILKIILFCTTFFNDAKGQSIHQELKIIQNQIEQKEKAKALISCRDFLKREFSSKDSLLLPEFYRQYGNAFNEVNRDSAAHYYNLSLFELEYRNMRYSIESVKALNNLAHLYKQVEPKKSLEYGNEAIEIADSIGCIEYPFCISVYFIVANLKMDEGNFTESLAFLKKIEKITKLEGDSVSNFYTSCILQQATCYRYLGNYPLAIENAIKSVNSQIKYGDTNNIYFKPNLANAYNELGKLFVEINNHQAESFLLKAANLYEQSLGTEHPYYIQCLASLARYYNQNDSVDLAIDLYLEQFDLAMKSNICSYRDKIIAITQATLMMSSIGDYEKSNSILLEIMKDPEYSNLTSEIKIKNLIQVANNYSGIRQFEKSIQINNQLLKMPDLEDYHVKIIILQNLANAYFSIGDTLMAEQKMSEKIEFAIDGYIEISNNLKSFQVVDYKADIEDDLWSALGYAIDAKRIQEDFGVFLINTLLETKEMFNTKYSRLVKEKIKIDHLKSKLSKDEAYVEIIKMPKWNLKSSNWDKEWIYFVVTFTSYSQGFKIIENSSEIEDLIIQTYLQGLRDEYFQDFPFDGIYKPLIEDIKNANTIYFSLGGVYNNINLNTLYNPETGKYLIEEKDIRIVNSARDFVLMKEREKKQYTSTTSALYGFPDYNGNTKSAADTTDYLAETRDLNQIWIDSLTRGGIKASSLPATKVEVEQIAGTFQKNGWKVSTYTGAEASETNIKKEESPRVLHVATHGYFFEDIPIDKNDNRFLGMDRQRVVQDPMLRSGLLFTGANKTLQGEEPNGENGLLSAAEVSLLDLRETELVVLSACETGKGEIKNSEGVYGLRKAFADAGAKNIIMSLWKVDDKVTQEFMTRFYEIWLNEKTTIREAFNRTQLEIKAKYPQPYYWGAFILVGE